MLPTVGAQMITASATSAERRRPRRRGGGGGSSADAADRHDGHVAGVAGGRARRLRRRRARARCPGVSTSAAGPWASTRPRRISTSVAANRRGQVQVVRRDRHRHAAVPVQRGQQRRDVELVAEIERRGRLVEQQHVGATAPAPRQSPRAASRRRSACGTRAPRGGRCRSRRAPRARSRSRPAPRPRNRPRWGWRPISTISSAVYSKASSVSCGTTAIRRAMSRRLRRSSGVPAEPHGARGGRARAAQQPQQRGLAGAVRPEHADELAVADGERDPVDDQRRARVIPEGDVIGLQQRALPRRPCGPGSGSRALLRTRVRRGSGRGLHGHPRRHAATCRRGW